MNYNVDKRRKKLLLIGAIVSALTLERLTFEKVEETNKVHALSEISNQSKNITKNINDSQHPLSISINLNYNFFKVYQIKEQIISNLANQFSQLYGLSADECSVIINENIDYIINSDNVIDELNTLVQTNIADGNLHIKKKKNILGSGTGNVEYVNNFKNTDRGQIFKKYANMYGVDYNFALALTKQESNLEHESNLPGGSNYNGFAYGFSQIENTLIGSKIKAFNFKTGQNETIEIVKDYPSVQKEGIIYLSVENFEENARIGIARLQSKLKKYKYNALMALQAYNYGDGAFELALNAYTNKTGKTIEEVINNKNDLGWIDYVLDLHQNPNQYLPDWQYQTYGDGYYIEHIAQYFSEPILEFKTTNNETIYVNTQDFTTATINVEELSQLQDAINIIENYSFINKTNTLTKQKKLQL